jgi:hypothetical protein
MGFDLCKPRLDVTLGYVYVQTNTSHHDGHSNVMTTLSSTSFSIEKSAIDFIFLNTYLINLRLNFNLGLYTTWWMQ